MGLPELASWHVFSNPLNNRPLHNKASHLWMSAHRQRVSTDRSSGGGVTGYSILNLAQYQGTAPISPKFHTAIFLEKMTV
jgi:hypothetical protein